MAWEYHVYLVDPDLDYIAVRHTFYGHTKEECLEHFEKHQDVCGSFGPAIEEGRYDDKWVEIESLPVVEEESSDGG
jgi:hypothetical protein